MILMEMNCRRKFDSVLGRGLVAFLGFDDGDRLLIVQGVLNGLYLVISFPLIGLHEGLRYRTGMYELAPNYDCPSTPVRFRFDVSPWAFLAKATAPSIVVRHRGYSASGFR